MNSAELQMADEGREAYRAVSRALNTMSDFPAEGFADEALRDHRTLQQSFMGVILTFVVRVAEAGDAERFDARNEASTKLAQQIRDMLKSTPYLIEQNEQHSRVAFPFI